MPWYAIRPRDPADARWPLPGKPHIAIKADDPSDARDKFEAAYRNEPYGTPGIPVPGTGPGTFHGDAEALVVEETGEPPAPEA